MVVNRVPVLKGAVPLIVSVLIVSDPPKYPLSPTADRESLIARQKSARSKELADFYFCTIRFPPFTYIIRRFSNRKKSNQQVSLDKIQSKFDRHFKSNMREYV